MKERLSLSGSSEKKENERRGCPPVILLCHSTDLAQTDRPKPVLPSTDRSLPASDLNRNICPIPSFNHLPRYRNRRDYNIQGESQQQTQARCGEAYVMKRQLDTEDEVITAMQEPMEVDEHQPMELVDDGKASGDGDTDGPNDFPLDNWAGFMDDKEEEERRRVIQVLNGLYMEASSKLLWSYADLNDRADLLIRRA